MSAAFCAKKIWTELNFHSYIDITTYLGLCQYRIENVNEELKKFVSRRDAVTQRMKN